MSRVDRQRQAERVARTVAGVLIGLLGCFMAWKTESEVLPIFLVAAGMGMAQPELLARTVKAAATLLRGTSSSDDSGSNKAEEGEEKK